MKIAALVANAIPDHLAGAERALHETLEYLSTRGHECVVLPRNGAMVERVVDGVRVMGQRQPGQAAELLRSSDVCFTQLEDTMFAQLLAVETQTPLVFYAHSPTQVESLGVIPEACSLVLWNSRWVAKECDWWPGDSLVLHPPTPRDRYYTETTGRAVTLIGLSHGKGVMPFLQAARDLPDVQFLGLQGSYSEQILDADGFVTYAPTKEGIGSAVKIASLPMPPNIHCGPPIPDVRMIFQHTRVLLVLSQHESWGRVAIEAAHSGIPTIAHPTPGLCEALGDAGRFVARDRSADLAATIREMVTDDACWQEWSDRARARAAKLDPEPQLRALDRRLKKIVKAAPALSLG